MSAHQITVQPEAALRISMAAALLAVMCVGGCEKTAGLVDAAQPTGTTHVVPVSEQAQEDAAKAADAAQDAAARAADAAAEANKADAVKFGSASEARVQTLRRTDRWEDYRLLAVSGPSVSGREFETQVMCKDVWKAADANVEFLTHLAVTHSESDMVSFVGESRGQPVEITMVLDLSGGHRVPSFLMMGTDIIASCS